MIPQLLLCKLLIWFISFFVTGFESDSDPQCPGPPKHPGPPKLVVDFHNFGYTILENKLSKGGKNHPVVLVLKFLEMWMSKYFIDHCFTVTKVMREVLVEEWGIELERIGVLYDKAHDRRKSVTQSGSLLSKSNCSISLWEKLYTGGYLEELKTWNDERKTEIASTSTTCSSDSNLRNSVFPLFHIDSETTSNCTTANAVSTPKS